MRVDGEGLGFSVKMGNGGHLHVSGGDAKGGVLDDLEFSYGGGGGVGVPDGSSVGG